MAARVFVATTATPPKLAEYVDATSGHTEAIDGHARGPKVHIILIDEL